MRQYFNQMDTNGDGFLTLDELKTYDESTGGVWTA